MPRGRKLEKCFVCGEPKSASISGHPLGEKCLTRIRAIARDAGQQVHVDRPAKQKENASAPGRLCKCGCGRVVPRTYGSGSARQYAVPGKCTRRRSSKDQPRPKVAQVPAPCACGCGVIITSAGKHAGRQKIYATATCKVRAWRQKRACA